MQPMNFETGKLCIAGLSSLPGGQPNIYVLPTLIYDGEVRADAVVCYAGEKKFYYISTPYDIPET